MEEYLNFDEAVEFLSTTKSTLYKWLKAGKVPAHKLGRQWRFREEELRKYIEGQGRENNSLTKLQNYLDEKRKEKMKSEFLDERSHEIAEKLIWDAVDSGAYGINLQPYKEFYEVSYRGAEQKDSLPHLDRAAFDSLDSFFMEISNPYRGEEKRRLFLSRDSGEERVDLQIQYVAMNTVLGKRLNLKIIRSDFTATKLEKVAHGEDLKKIKELLSGDHGVVAVTGGTGSGKTTTLYCAIQELIDRGNLVFTLEDPVNFIIEGANQIEVDMQDEKELGRAMADIYDSDPDVVCLGLGSGENLYQQIKMASKFSESGHLVLIQLQVESPEMARKLLIDGMGTNEKLIRGIIHQKLEKQEDGGRKAVYNIQS